jgi:hypothetical protein
MIFQDCDERTDRSGIFQAPKKDGSFLPNGPILIFEGGNLLGNLIPHLDLLMEPTNLTHGFSQGQRRHWPDSTSGNPKQEDSVYLAE